MLRLVGLPAHFQHKCLILEGELAPSFVKTKGDFVPRSTKLLPRRQIAQGIGNSCLNSQFKSVSLSLEEQLLRIVRAIVQRRFQPIGY